MDLPPRSPPLDSGHTFPEVTGSSVRSPPANSSLASRAVAGSPARTPPSDDPISSRASAVRDEAVAGATFRLPPTDSLLAARDSAVGEEAVTGSQVPSPLTNNLLASGASVTREEAVSGSPVRSPPTNNRLAARAPSLRDKAVTVPPVGSPSHSPSREKTNVFVPRPPRSWIITEEAVTGSGVRSPSPPAESQTAPIKVASPIIPRALVTKDEAVTGSPVRSVSESPTASPKGARATVSPSSGGVSNEAVIGSPVSSPLHPQAKHHEKQHSFYSDSSSQSPNRDAEKPDTSPPPPHKETAYSSPMRGATTVGSIIFSSLGDAVTEDLNSLEGAASPATPMANRMVMNETTSASKVGGRNGGARELTRVKEGTLRKPVVRKAAVGLRILALVLSLISFSIMAADKTSGWDGDSFDRYTEFRYCLSINVLAFVYSLFQVCAQFHRKIKRRRLMSRPVSYCFNFFMDQILAYLLMSASSAAASRNGDWVADFGSDDFTKMINGSIATSFLAFFALAFSSIFSAHQFFGWKY